MKKHEIEEWLLGIDKEFTAELEKLRLEIRTLKARLQELEDRPPPAQFNPFLPISSDTRRPIPAHLLARRDAISRQQ